MWLRKKDDNAFMIGHLHGNRANERTITLRLPGFYPSVEPRCSGRTVGSRTWRLLRPRNPSRQRQEAMRSSPLSDSTPCNRRATAGSLDPQRRIAFCEARRISRRPTVMRLFRLSAHCKCTSRTGVACLYRAGMSAGFAGSKSPRPRLRAKRKRWRKEASTSGGWTPTASWRKRSSQARDSEAAAGLGKLCISSACATEAIRVEGKTASVVGLHKEEPTLASARIVRSL
jgi:hypothetical protein